MINKMKERFAAMKMSGKKGFTLIELVVVIAIMAILALIMVPNLTAYIQKADDSKIQANLKNIHTAAEMVSQTSTDGALDAGEITKFANVDVELSEPADGKYTVAKDEATGIVTVSYKDSKATYTFDGKNPEKNDN
mgnify:CR=1 FL=1